MNTSVIDVARVYRVVREIEHGEGPVSGTLVRDGEDAAVLVPAERLAGWPGWRVDDAEHLLHPRDVVRRDDGHDALLPWCNERVERWLDRRRDDGPRLRGGELVSLAVCFARGVQELRQRRDGLDEERGAWWLTDAARPLFAVDVPGAGERSGGEGDTARAQALLLLDRAAGMCTDTVARREVQELRARLEEGLSRDELSACEERLFSLCAPQALDLAYFVPSPARQYEGSPFAVRADPERGWVHALMGHLDSDMADATARFLSSARRRAARRWAAILRRDGAEGRDVLRASGASGDGDRRSRRVARRGPVLVAAAAAIVVVGAGALWPSSGHAGAAAEGGAGRGVSSVPSEEGRGSDVGQESGGRGEPGLNESARTRLTDTEVIALLDSAGACDGRESCADAVEGAVARVPDTFLDAPDRGVTLVDDYGDAVLYAVSVGDRTIARALVSRVDGKWLVRGVYDAADQPK